MIVPIAPYVAVLVAAVSGPIAAAELPRARSGDVAIRQEYDLALQVGTIAALERFVERHPSHPLAKDALRRKRALDKKAQARCEGGDRASRDCG